MRVAVEVRGLVERFGATHRRRRARPGAARRVGARAARPQRRGQDHHRRGLRGLPRRRRGRGPGARHRPHGRARRAARPHRRDAPGRRRLPRCAGGRDAAPRRGLLGAPARPGVAARRARASPACARTPYKRLSGGQQQRLALACAVVGRPELVFLDEPTAGLDPQARRLVWELVGALRRDGVAVLLTTHLMEEAEALADDVVIVDHGRVVAHGSPAALTSTGPQQELRFRAKPGMDLTGLATALPPEYHAAEPIAGRYLVAGPDRPRGALHDHRVVRAAGRPRRRRPGGAPQPRGRVPRAHRTGAALMSQPRASPPAPSRPRPARAVRSRCSPPRPASSCGSRCATASRCCSRCSSRWRCSIGLTLVTLVPLPDPRVAAVTPGGARARGDVHGVHRRRPSRSASTAATA